MDNRVRQLGFYAALLAFIASLGYDVVQTLQMVGVLRYPADAISIYAFSLLIPMPFVFAMLALHYSVANEKKIWSHAALLFIAMYATLVTLNYVVQLATVIPMTLRGAGDTVRLLDQTPHSLFWDIDALGYIFMGLSTCCAIPVFENKGMELWTRRFFLAHTLMTPVIAFVYFYPAFSFTLLLFAAPWMITASGSLLCLALYYSTQHPS